MHTRVDWDLHYSLLPITHHPHLDLIVPSASRLTGAMTPHTHCTSGNLVMPKGPQRKGQSSTRSYSLFYFGQTNGGTSKLGKSGLEWVEVGRGRRQGRVVLASRWLPRRPRAPA